MPWNNDEARRRVFGALLDHQEILGEEETIALLRNELTRLTVLQEHRRTNAENLRLTRLVGELEADLDAAVDALGFYSDPDNYEERAGSRPSAVRKDKGDNAREALEALTAAAEKREEEGEANGQP